MKIFRYLKKLNSFSVIIVPEDTSHGTKSKKFTLSRILLFAVLYSLFIGIIGYYLFGVTGIGPRFFPGSDKLSSVSSEDLEKLNDRVAFLARELQVLKSTNQKLKYALALGDSSLIDSLGVNIDTLRQLYKTPREGNIFGAVIVFFTKLFIQQEKSVLFILPANGYISRAFAPDKGHYGIDIVLKDGTPVYAAAGGYVVFSGYTNNYGHTIILNHSDGYLSVYKHCSLVIKKEREFVRQGELIALSGNSGLATTGPHLHFEIWLNGKPIDPESILLKNK